MYKKLVFIGVCGISLIGCHQTKASELAEVDYQSHIQNIGWQRTQVAGNVSGTVGQRLRVEGIKISLNKPNHINGSISYRAHVQNIGWQNYVRDGQLAGTTGKSLRVEAIQIKLTGELAQQYDVRYQVHVQNIGWQAWKENNAVAGTTGKSLRVEAIKIKLVKKDNRPSEPTYRPVVIHTKNQTLQQGDSWNPRKGFISGTDEYGRALVYEQLQVVGTVNPNKPGKYRVSYRYRRGDGLVFVSDCSVTVTAKEVQKQPPVIRLKASNLIVGETWNPENNFISGTDELGQPLRFAQLRVNNEVNIHKPGTYSVKYSYQTIDGKIYSESTTVTVIAKVVKPTQNVEIKTQTVTLNVGDIWEKRAGIVSATDEFGQDIPFEKIRVSGTVDTSKTGNYLVNYQYYDSQGNYYGATAQVIVKKNIQEHSREAMRQEMLRLINQFRAANGVGPLQYNDRLNQATDIRAREIIQKFSHTRPNGEDCWSVLGTSSSNFGPMGENIAQNYQGITSEETANKLFTAWKNSEGHRKNMLNSSFNQLGFSVELTKNGLSYGVQMFGGSK